jgi:hypothetical protein
MRRALFAALLLAVPRAALACPVCFGDVSSPMAAAANMGIIVMLVVVGVVLAGFASFFVYLARRARLVAAESGPADAGHHLGQVSNPHEGIVRC